MNAKSKIVKFNNQQVPVFIQGDKPYVLMKPICENIGLDWNSQKKRINRNAVLSKGKVMMTSPSNGGDQEYIALPLGMLNGWLMGVDANKVKPESISLSVMTCCISTLCQNLREPSISIIMSARTFMTVWLSVIIVCLDSMMT